jgi:hypothetical protein
MAPRRLLAVMVGLLVLSSIAAALVPVNPNDKLDTTEPSTGAKLPAPRLPSGGRLVEDSVRIESGKRPVIDTSVGDQLALRISAAEPTTLEVEGLGATADVDPSTPARFNLLLLDAGSYAINELSSGRTVATIEVAPRRPASRDAKPGHPSKPGPGHGSKSDTGASEQV